MNCLKSLLFKDRAVTARIRAGLDGTTGATGGAEVGIRDTAGARVEVSLPSIKVGPEAAPASSSSLIRGKFRQGLWQTSGLAIALVR